MAIANILNGDTGLVARNIINALVAFVNAKRNGVLDYADLATATTPITPAVDTWTKLTNDGAGAFTNKTYTPDGVTDLWDVVADDFDFSQLSLGDTIAIRFDVDVTTNSPNVAVSARMAMAIGSGAAYHLIVGGETIKAAGTYQVTETIHVYMGDDNTRLNPAEFEVLSDAVNTNFKVNGWAIFISRNGH